MAKGHVKPSIILVLLVFASMVAGILRPILAQATSISQLFITEVQVRDSEFIEIYNPYDEAVSLQGWQVKYRGGGATETNLKTFGTTDNIAPKSFLLLTRNFIPQDGTLSWSFSASLANDAGYVVLYDASGSTVDLVGWGSSTLGKQGSPAASPGINQSVQRCFTNGLISVTDPHDNSLEFLIYGLTSPGQGVACVVPELADVCVNIEGVQESIPSDLELDTSGNCIQPPTCLIEISELSAQPNYDGQEYIEIHNSGQLSATLSLCKLKINTGSERMLSGELQPGQYLVVSFTSGVIRNSAGTVTLINSNQESIVYSYPETSSTQTVNFISGSQTGTVSDKATPNAPNELVLLSEEELALVSDSTTLAACPAGKYRNPETNRCKNIESADTLTPCQADQERSPETNRCRKVATSTLTPCKEGQERNSETNRCRKVDSESSLTPCQPGQERNPETNRCRKVAASTNAALSAATNTAAINPTRFSYKLVLLVLAAVIGYGVYEYRIDLQKWYRKLRVGRQKGRPPG